MQRVSYLELPQLRLVTVQPTDLTFTGPIGDYLTLPIERGIHDAAQYQAFMSADDYVEIADSVQLIESAPVRLTPLTFGDVALHTGANPDYRPASVVDAQAHMMARIRQLDRRNDVLARRMKAFSDAEFKRQERLLEDSPPPLVDDDVSLAKLPKTSEQEEVKDDVPGQNDD